MELHKNRRNDMIGLFMCIIISSIVVFLLYGLWDFDWNVPIYYTDGDYLSTLAIIKRTKNLKEFFVSSNLGAPFKGSNFDYPYFGEVFNLLYFKLFSHVFGIFKGINLAFFLLYPITSIISFFVMKKLEVCNLWAVLGSVIFAFLPYRMLRNTAHLFLNCYFQIPIAILFCFWLIQDDRFLRIGKGFFKYKRNLIGIFGFMLIAYTGIYYAFFTAFFICVAAIFKIVNSKKIQYLKNGVLACISLCMPLVISYIPYIIFRYKYGVNIEKPARSPIEAEVYGMKIAQLFIPIKDYGIEFIKSLRENYASAPVPNEGSEYLGIVGIIGFVLLIFCLFISKQNGKMLGNNIMILSRLNCFAILLGTIGGFGSVFALLISPQIRGYNRISVFIAYFSILSVCFVLTNLSDKLKKGRLVPIIIIFLLSMIDQINIGSFNTVRKETVWSFYSDQKFVSEIERLVSEKAMIYQWVYQPYPEHPPIYQMGDYASIRGYLHSDNLKWSYGDQKGRNSDLWNRDLASKSMQERIDIISNVGFEGIYIDTNAYSEEELSELVEEMTSILNESPFISEDRRLMFFQLNPYVQKYKKNYSETEWNKMKNENLTLVQFFNGFYGIETDEKNHFSWRWCSKKGDIKVVKNDLEENGTLSMNIYSETEKESKVTVQWNDEKAEYFVSNKGRKIVVPLEQNVTDISILIDGEKVDAPDDPRELYMRLEDIHIEYEK